MFEYIHMENFRSFGNTTIDFTSRDGSPKKLVIIYGANGSGKTNIASAFSFLSDSIRTMDMRAVLNSILENHPNLADRERIKMIISTQLKDMDQLISSNKLIESDGPMVLDFGLNIDDKRGRYLLEMDNEQIIHERLEFVINKYRGVYYDITPDNTYINNRIFHEKSAHQEIQSACSKFWGKHSLLSIIVHEAQDKAIHYITEQISDNLNAIIGFLFNLSCKINFPGEEQEGNYVVLEQMLRKYDVGSILNEEETLLDRNEAMLNHFFKCVSKNTVRVFYERKKDNDLIKYSLYQTKQIAGKQRDIPFRLESRGAKSLLQLIPYMLLASNGCAVVIDEFESGMHDILTQSIIQSLEKSIKGQIIMTTHATILMRTSLAKNIFIIDEDEFGDKNIRAITSHDPKLNSKSNIRNKYLDGEYGGIPDNISSLDFDELNSYLGT